MREEEGLQPDDSRRTMTDAWSLFFLSFFPTSFGAGSGLSFR